MKTKRAEGVNPSRKAGRLKTQEEMTGQFKSESRKKADVPVQDSQQEFPVTHRRVYFLF